MDLLMPRSRKMRVVAALLLAYVALACALQRPGGLAVHRWWEGLGPVIPHDSFPAECSLCHEGTSWNQIRADFEFHHGEVTGVPLTGSHQAASCLRCHNDRGHVSVFAAKGCAGCHEDVHQGQLGPDCRGCHTEDDWRPYGQIERHDRTRFPLVGAHQVTACHRCHVGAEVGRFVPTDIECLSCHTADLARAQFPDHAGLGWVNNCDDCHLPTTWSQAEIR